MLLEVTFQRAPLRISFRCKASSEPVRRRCIDGNLYQDALKETFERGTVNGFSRWESSKWPFRGEHESLKGNLWIRILKGIV